VKVAYLVQDIILWV